MKLEAFRDKVQYYRRLSGYSQEELAQALGIQRPVLSRKFSGTNKAYLTIPEVKLILKTLVEWDAVTQQAHLEELLELAELPLNTFKPEEWKSPPLNRLKQTKLTTPPVKAPANSIRPEVTMPPALPKSNLPLALTQLIGREQVTAELGQWLARPEVRLLTITGTGGIGKTRLALQVGQEVLPRFKDGTFFVPLDSLTNPTLVLDTIAKELGLQEISNTTLLELLKNYLRNKELLLILDNFEHLLEATSLVETLLANAPQLKILVTSRVSLRLYGEWEFEVPLLEVPAQTASGLASLSTNPSIALFVERTQALNRNFVLTEENTVPIAEICVCLEGLPLALELAAARTRLFPLAVLRDEIKASQLAWLADNKFQRPSRQQTLRGALDWSYRLLEPEEQKLFCRLALFAGGFGLETARAVTSPSLDLMLVANLAQNRCVTNYAVAFPGLNLMLLLESLLTRSLLKLVATTDGTNRYKMLQVTREYALEKFAEQSESIAVGWQFALYFINWTKEVVPKLNGPHQRAMLHKLETEHANLRAILDYALEHKIADIALSLSGILLDFWEIGGHWSEGCNYLSRTLALDSSDFAGQAMCKKALGLLLQDLGDYTESLKWLEQAQVNFETLNDSLNLSQTRRWMGHFYARKNQMATAQKLAESSLELAQQEQDRLAIANTLNLLGRIALYQSNFEQARDFCEKSLALQRELENPSGIFRAVNQLGIIAHRQGDYESALAFFTGALNISQDLVNKRLISNSTSSLGWVYLSSGEYGLAIAAFLKALVLQRELGDKTNCAVSLNNLGKLTELQGNFEQARRYGEDSVLLYRELGDKQGFSYALNNLGVTLHRQQDFGRAQLLYEESILLKREAGDRWALAYTLTRCSLLLCQQGQYLPALRVLQESLELLQQIKSLEEIANGLLVLAVIAFALKQPQIAFQLNCLSLNVLAESRTGKFEPLFQTDYEKLADTLALENGAEHNLTLEQTVEFALNTLQVLVKNEPSHI